MGNRAAEGKRARGMFHPHRRVKRPEAQSAHSARSAAMKHRTLPPRSPTTVAWLHSHHGTGKSHGTRIHTRGATREHSARDHGGFDTVHDDTLTHPLTAECITNLGRPLLLGSRGPSIGITQREDAACS
jgi:hypothetical protein